ncbi:NADP-dependent oxidoreductase domain-containing protein [Fusarium redolens]|uniref:NADP-dependent oxidoreductase domain-containing protein n=1 Tax=Fusarium redolens TaxID=48865 RepID=A0A9P9JZZ6_FUSRE|nr:NADP-dependent oxidoreductase domain-containing protein [Fusarium redolens]KAH7244047.1 NADP-dependent oxidoreductase domain-containing protein [Fusarium redolens]
MAPPVQLPLRQLTKNGPKIPSIGLGLMGISVAYGAATSNEERLKLLDRAWELGCTNWDTADVYGDSEDVVGKWFKLHPERRQDIFLATKFGLRAGDKGIVTDSSPEHVRKSIESSLKRLGVEHIDLYYMHRANEAVPIEKTVEAMKQLVDEGKVKYLGLSEISSTTLRRAHAVHPISAVQVEYNPWTLDIEGPSGTNLLKACEELDVAVFAYSPLGRGILTGRFRSVDDFEETDTRRRLTRFKGDNFKKNLEIVDEFNELAKSKGYTSSQLVLAWILEQSPKLFVIPGTKKIKYLEENVGAAKVKLSKEENQELRKLAVEAGVAGGRDSFFGCFVDTAPLEK